MDFLVVKVLGGYFISLELFFVLSNGLHKASEAIAFKEQKDEKEIIANDIRLAASELYN